MRSLLALAFLFPTAASAVPLEMNHQGRVHDALGNPLDGSHDLTFSLYSTVSGGSAEWTETHSENLDSGYFSVILGSSTSLDSALFDSDDLWLAMAVDGGQELPTRVKLTSSAFAFRSANATNVVGGIVDASEIRVDGTTVIDATGAVTADVDWSTIQNIPTDVSDGDADTLAGLGCSADQVAYHDGTSWTCASWSTLTVDGGQITGSIGIGALPVGTGSTNVAAGDASYPKAQVYTRAEVDALLSAAAFDPETLTQRVTANGGLGSAYTHNVDYVATPNTYLPFKSTGGPVKFDMSIPMSGGSHSMCALFIDGINASHYTNADTSYFWSDGIEYTIDGWAMWNPTRVYEGIPAGDHVATVKCRDDATGSDAELGNGRMWRTISAVPYDPTASASVKAYQQNIRGGQTSPTSYSSVNGLNLQMETTGGPVLISLSIPFSGGSHASCRPLIDGVPAGANSIDDTSYTWQEGLTRSNDGWAMWNRSRMYDGVSAGTHNVTVECITNSDTVDLGNSRMPLHLSAVTFPDPSSSPTVKTAHVDQRQVHSISVGQNWVDLTGLTASITTNGGPLELGVSLPIENGSHSTCRPTLNGSHVFPGEGDDYGYIWSEGLAITNDGWAQWDRVRVYENVPAGSHTLGVQCRTDGGTASFGHPQMVSHLWAVTYDE